MNYFRFSFGKIRRIEPNEDCLELWKRIRIDRKKTSYEVSNLGRVRNIKTLVVKVPHLRKDGYLYVQLHVGKRLRMINVHRLVAIAFIPNPNNKPQVNHIDGIKFHNMVNNLEWVTASENTKHAVDNGLLVNPSGVDAKHAIYPREQIVQTIELLKLKTMTSKEISEVTGVKLDTVNKIRSGKQQVKLSNELGFVPDVKHNFDFSPYEKEIRKLVEMELQSKDIRKKLPLPINDNVYNHFIRKVRKDYLEGSTTIRIVP